MKDVAGALATSKEGWGSGTSLLQRHLQGAQHLHDPGAPLVGSGQVLTARAPAVRSGWVTHPCVPMLGSGPELRQQLARMLSWAWAAQMHTDASGSCLKFSRAELWGGEWSLLSLGSHLSLHLILLTLCLSLGTLLSIPSSPSSSNCSCLSKLGSKPAFSRKASWTAQAFLHAPIKLS